MRWRQSILHGLAALALVVSGCGDAPTNDVALSPSFTFGVTTSLEADIVMTTTTFGPPTTRSIPGLTLPPTTLPATSAPPSTSGGDPPTTTVPAPTSPAPTLAPVPMAEARDLDGILTVDATDWEPGDALTVSLAVTNRSDRRVTLDDPGTRRFVAARASVGGDVFGAAYLWLGDTELEPGARHTMTRLWTPELDAQSGDLLVIEAVIAESADSFNRAQNTHAVLDAVLAVDLPVP